MPEPQARIGRIVSVSGSQVVMLHDRLPAQAGSGDTGALQIGSLLKMHTPDRTVFGMISGLSIPVPATDKQDTEMKIVELELLGETANGAAGGGATGGDANGKANSAANGATNGKSNGTTGGRGAFRRGVSIFPSLGDGVFATTPDDLGQVYACPDAATVKIGRVHQDQSLPAYVLTDDLLAKHFAILGATGSGKSCAVALLLRAILAKHANAHILVLDPHAEYASALGESATVLSPDNLQLPYWLLNFEEFVEVVLGEDAAKMPAAVAILSDAIPAAKRQFLGDAASDLPITIDTPVPYRLTDLVQTIDDAMGKLDKPEDSAPYLKLKGRLNALRADRRFAFMFGGLSVRDNMAEILSRILRIPVDGKPATIMDLSGVPSEIINVVVSVLARLTFDFALWSERAVPILLVCEEAHRYAPRDEGLGFEPTKRALARIAKEGRKYGVSLCVVSQRPSELDPNMLSQCSTVFAMRLNIQSDQDFVRAAMRESATGLLDFLPSLLNAEAIAVGEGVPVPVRLAFDSLPEDQRPRGGTARFSAAWQQDGGDKALIESVITRWRRQRR